MTSEALDFTGERFTPECVREMRYEHWHRYAFARPGAYIFLRYVRRFRGKDRQRSRKQARADCEQAERRYFNGFHIA